MPFSRSQTICMYLVTLVRVYDLDLELMTFILELNLDIMNTYQHIKTRNSSVDEIPERDIALFCYPSCI